jgi:phosphoribosylanthranilate isomerase
MWIKICGNTSLEDAHLALSLGADALGFIFAPSKRRVTPAQVAAITPHLRSEVELVGVFQSHTTAQIAQIVHRTGLTAVQLHGTEQTVAEAVQTTTEAAQTTQRSERRADPFQLARDLHQTLGDRIRIIQSLHWTVAMRPSRTHPEPQPPAETAVQADCLRRQIDALAQIPAIDRILIDSRVGSSTGGTGVPFDWAAARSALSAIPPHLQLILAGGLAPGNVTEAIRILQPWGVDAVSGVEALPGRKDAKKLAAFIANARA